MNYREYMASDAWKALRLSARDRSDHKCEMCGGSADNVHHVKYPKGFGNDGLSNLIVLCRKCHERTHGIRGEKMTNQKKEMITFTDSTVIPVVLTFVDGVEYRLFSDVFRACCQGDQSPHWTGAQNTRMAIERELIHDKEFMWIDYDTGNGLQRMQFLTLRGALKVATFFHNTAGATVRNYLLDVHDKHIGISKSSIEDEVEDSLILLLKNRKEVRLQMRKANTRINALEIEQAETTKKIDDMTGGDIEATTARGYLNSVGVNPAKKTHNVSNWKNKDNASALGMACFMLLKKYPKRWPIHNKILEGTFMVGVLDMGLLGIAAKKIGLT